MNKCISPKDRKPKIAILVNVIAPYRVPIYRFIGDKFRLEIFCSGYEDNRSTWGLQGPTKLKVRRSWGVTFKIPKGHLGKVFDNSYFHITPGYILDLLCFKPDAVITNEMGFRTLVALLYCSLFRKPIWVWWGGTLHTERSRGRVRLALRWLIARWAQRWISYGQTSTEYLTSLAIPSERILQIQNCVDEEAFTHAAVKPALDLQPSPVLLYVGQMIGRKGVRFLLESASRLQQEGWTFSLLLVGSGPEKEVLEAFAYELRLKNVFFYPAQSPERMPAIYRSANCLIFPTMEDVWGLVVNEALWSEIPALTSIYAGCALEIVPPEHRFDPLDSVDFDRALRLALSGKINHPDTTRMMTCQQVAEIIINDVYRILRI